MRLHEAAQKLIIQERLGDKVKVSSYWPVPELTRAGLALGRLQQLYWRDTFQISCEYQPSNTREDPSHRLPSSLISTLILVSNSAPSNPLSLTKNLMNSANPSSPNMPRFNISGMAAAISALPQPNTIFSILLRMGQSSSPGSAMQVCGSTANMLRGFSCVPIGFSSGICFTAASRSRRS